ncbi:GAD-like domain protein, partial [Salmonella enterica]|nr:GAD-like domain protein [Salmonella enterica]EBU8761823.1 GAD-like domain protein [Salmonella enterica subsp. enterica serovar Senftenberg]EDI7192917.1 GAD-like domain protein [Salmonella enterica subsp. enterica serovar Senftenberg]EHU7438971.1 GAD-like domain protein [Salmonella enterica]HBQ3880261.1 GAD-like domain protein [Salmonella enterica subsp. enterica serovar Senftenberg]
MRDQDISYFIEKFGEATSYSAVPEKSMTKWKGILPDKLLSYWKTEEWGTYKNGLFSLVNPDKDEVVLDIWLEDTPFKEMDAYHVIARSA